MIARYWGQITLVDRQIGSILDELKMCGLEENTIVVFTSDHSEMMGDLGMLRKAVLFEPSIRVPLMMHFPGLTDRRIMIDGPVSQVDLVPTLLDAFHQSVETKLDGTSLLPLIRGERKLTGDAFVEWNGPDGAVKWFEPYMDGPDGARMEAAAGAASRTVITREGWKLSLSEADEHELYDLNSNPSETKNLFFPGASATRQQLTEKLLAWQKRTGDSVDLISTIDRFRT